MSRFKELDTILKAFCSSKGDSLLHTYTQHHPVAVRWLRESHQHIGGRHDFMRITLPAKTDNNMSRAIRIPDGIDVADVGVVVKGQFVPMKVNPVMVLAMDECLSINPMGSGHPDLFPAFIDGQVEKVSWTYIPGMPSSSGLRGYWKWWRDLGILQVDGLSTHSEIVIAYPFVPYVPGVMTMVDSRAEEALRAFLHLEHTKNMHKARPRVVTMTDIQAAEIEYNNRLRLYIQLKNSKPYHLLRDLFAG